MAIRLLLADDHALFRQGLVSLLKLEPDFEVAAEVERAADLEQTLSTTPCDMLLLDLQLERSSMDDIPRLAQMTKVIVLTRAKALKAG